MYQCAKGSNKYSMLGLIYHRLVSNQGSDYIKEKTKWQYCQSFDLNPESDDNLQLANWT